MKKIVLNIFAAGFVSLLLSIITAGQPSCREMDSFSVVCNRHYESADLVFLGKVVEIKRPGEYDDLYIREAIVEVETALKGKLPEKISLFYGFACDIRKGHKYIITAENKKPDSLRASPGPYAEIRFTPLRDYTEAQVNAVLNEIRATIKGRRLPPLAGTLIRNFRTYYFQNAYSFDPYGVWVPNIRAEEGIPFTGVEIVAEDAAGKRFTTVVQEDGRFIFSELPYGRYKVFPLLSDKFDLHFSGNHAGIYKDGVPYVGVEERQCGMSVNINAREVGSLSLSVSDVGEPLVLNHRIYMDKITKDDELPHQLGTEAYEPAKFNIRKGETGTELKLVFDKLTTGKYLLHIAPLIDGYSRMYFYPGTFESKRAIPVEIKPGETTSISLKHPRKFPE